MPGLMQHLFGFPLSNQHANTVW